MSLAGKIEADDVKVVAETPAQPLGFNLVGRLFTAIKLPILYSPSSFLSPTMSKSGTGRVSECSERLLKQ